jgi:F plasmid transfer operon, TraF, protein
MAWYMLAPMRRIRQFFLFVFASALMPSLAATQGFEVIGTRAAGMGGAFVAVTDDASAVYWNPGALASGAYFSLLLDWNEAKATRDNDPALGAGTQSGTLFSIAALPVGVSYYRLRDSNVRPASGGNLRLDTLITHHAGVTFVQSLGDRMSVGGTVKLVRGIAATDLRPPDGRDADDLLDDADDLVGHASNKFDADLGVLVALGTFRAGLTVRNVSEPEFEVAGSSETLRLERQARAGISLVAATGLLVAFDADLIRTPGPLGDVRNIALGAEARVVRRGFVRVGVRANTVDDQPAGRAPVFSLGGSYAVFGSLLVDGQFTGGSEAGGPGWGLAARIVF